MKSPCSSPGCRAAARLTQARVWLVVLVAVLALAVPAAAGAGSQNYYTGGSRRALHSTADSGTAFGVRCTVRRAPSGTTGIQTSGTSVTVARRVLCTPGFQNNARWRHREFYVGDGGGICLNAYINPSDLQMGGQYLESHVLYSSGASTYGYGWAFA